MNVHKNVKNNQDPIFLSKNISIKLETMSMLPQNKEFRITVLPLFASGHIIPIIDMARLFARHGATVTIIATESNASIFQNNIDHDFAAGFKIQTHIVSFPGAEVGLAPGIENYSDVSSRHLQAKIYQAFLILDKLIDQVPSTFFNWFLV